MLQFYFSRMSSFTQTYEIRRVLYGIASIISNDVTKAPELLRNEISTIMNIVVVLINAYVNAKEKEINEELEEVSQMKAIEANGLEEIDEFRKILEKINDIKQKEGKLFDFDADEEEQNDLYDPADELIFTAADLELYDSPLEEVDAPIYFKNIMDKLQESNPDLYTVLTGSLSQEQNDLLATVKLLKNPCKSFEKNEMLLKIEKKA